MFQKLYTQINFLLLKNSAEPAARTTIVPTTAAYAKPELPPTMLLPLLVGKTAGTLEAGRRVIVVVFVKVSVCLKVF